MCATPAPIAAEDHQLATAVAETEPPSSSANRPSLATPRLSQTPAVSPTSLSTDAPPPPRPALPTPPPPQPRQTSPSPTPGKVQWMPKKCPHGKRRTQCLACFDLGDGGGSICPHRRRKDLCGACKRARKEVKTATAAAAEASDGAAGRTMPFSVEALLGH
ncbi:hypothetical protein DFJ73DRAFT_781200 [Zopfochytrium polystomum]|nr:hypothetical protein DFJ73DRAFT_781200 [Zopfochytrium polystomum]